MQCNDVGQMLPEALDQALVLAKGQGKVRVNKHQQLCAAITYGMVHRHMQ